MDAKRVNKMKENPAWNTWPTATNYEGWKLRKLHMLEHNIYIVIKFKRRERWLMLKADLGQEYLERIKQINYEATTNYHGDGFIYGSGTCTNIIRATG